MVDFEIAWYPRFAEIRQLTGSVNFRPDRPVTGKVSELDRGLASPPLSDVPSASPKSESAKVSETAFFLRPSASVTTVKSLNSKHVYVAFITVDVPWMLLWLHFIPQVALV
ncbi:hypothetical protein GH714_032044 [Hevea brasiliensis]|uniref:Uncharacterized protein n=1 Tax=Hevea brasiliensis TaxID=3981 RepID=A0A6A6LEN2_HEVBR|nr:hypothetical protein GH714_032044 [Hevea brasiliensis]